MLVSNPRGLTWEEWHCALISDNGLALSSVSEKDWQEWAASLRDAINADDSTVPDPYQYDDWVLWEEAAALGLEQN